MQKERQDSLDLWGPEPCTSKADAFEQELPSLSKKPSLYPVSLHRKYKNTKIRASVPKSVASFLPPAGASYHPDEDEHQEALAVAVSHVVRAETANRRLAEKIGKIGKSPKKDDQLPALRKLLQPLSSSETAQSNPESDAEDSDSDDVSSFRFLMLSFCSVPQDSSETDDTPERMSRWQKMRLRGKRNSRMLRHARSKKLENEARIALAGGRVGKWHPPPRMTPEKIRRRLAQKKAQLRKKDPHKLGKHKSDAPSLCFSRLLFPHTSG
jgi:hypothetical protein